MWAPQRLIALAMCLTYRSQAAGFSYLQIPKFQNIPGCVWGLLPAFACERGCSAMDVAACCAHACLLIAGGRAAAFNGVFQHHTPCVDYISVGQAGQQDLHSGKVCQPSLPCPALHCARLLSLFLRAWLTTPCLALGRWSFLRFLHP